MSQTISLCPSAAKPNSVHMTTPSQPLVTIDPCLNQAKKIVRHIETSLHQKRNQHYCDIFISLADGDTAIGLLAYYLWRRRGRRQR